MNASTIIAEKIARRILTGTRVIAVSDLTGSGIKRSTVIRYLQTPLFVRLPDGSYLLMEGKGGAGSIDDACDRLGRLPDPLAGLLDRVFRRWTTPTPVDPVLSGARVLLRQGQPFSRVEVARVKFKALVNKGVPWDVAVEKELAWTRRLTTFSVQPKQKAYSPRRSKGRAKSVGVL